MGSGQEHNGYEMEDVLFSQLPEQQSRDHLQRGGLIHLAQKINSLA